MKLSGISILIAKNPYTNLTSSLNLFRVNSGDLRVQLRQDQNFVANFDKGMTANGLRLAAVLVFYDVQPGAAAD